MTYMRSFFGRFGHSKMLFRAAVVPVLVFVLLWSGGCASSITPLHRAAAAGQIDVLEQELASGADVNVKAGNGGTALHNAAFYGHRDAAELLGWGRNTLTRKMKELEM